MLVPLRLHCTVAPGAKPDPKTNSVKLPLPSCTLPGLRLVMVGLILGVTPIVAVSVTVAETVSWLIVTVTEFNVGIWFPATSVICVI